MSKEDVEKWVAGSADTGLKDRFMGQYAEGTDWAGYWADCGALKCNFDANGKLNSLEFIRLYVAGGRALPVVVSGGAVAW